MKQQKFIKKPLFFLALLILGLAAFFFARPSLLKSLPTINEISSSGSVSLTLSPPTMSLKPNVGTTIALIIDSGTDRLTYTKFEITYDPSKLAISGLAKGTWITRELTPLTHVSGKITGELGANPDSSTTGGPELQRTGSGSLLSFEVKGLAPGTHTLTLDSNISNVYTISGIIPNTTNMLKAVGSTTITVSDPRLKTDLVGDSRMVDKFDYVELVNQYGKIPSGSADFDGDGNVGGSDYVIFMADYGKTW